VVPECFCRFISDHQSPKRLSGYLRHGDANRCNFCIRLYICMYTHIQYIQYKDWGPTRPLMTYRSSHLRRSGQPPRSCSSPLNREPSPCRRTSSGSELSTPMTVVAVDRPQLAVHASFRTLSIPSIAAFIFAVPRTEQIASGPRSATTPPSPFAAALNFASSTRSTLHSL
jgi:hypothetical protein